MTTEKKMTKDEKSYIRSTQPTEMTVREKFAAYAMQSLINKYGDSDSVIRKIAARSYEIADLMMNGD